jgi:hypothetical protein
MTVHNLPASGPKLIKATLPTSTNLVNPYKMEENSHGDILGDNIR